MTANLAHRHRLAVDIGGTFVDAVLFDVATGEWRLEKSFTTPSDAATGVGDAIRRLGLDGTTIGSFVHGTTLGLNTVLERKGARTGILTNAGFEDIFEMGRYSRERTQMYSLEYDVAPPLVPRRMRLGIPGRMNARGEEIQPLDEAAVRAAVKRLVEEWGVRTIAVCYLHAYRNPAHERRTAEIIRAGWPDLAVSVSSDIVREYREYERTSTTVVNAYVQPIFRRYIGSLERALAARDFSGAFYITRSGGGALLAHDAIDTPIHTIFSGPAGGIIGAAWLSRVIDRENLIAVDIGGTSTDACVVRGGAPALKYQAALARLPLMIPTYDISTIGAGGGSIARVEGGLLKVGPQSAGAEPGPICYGRGGTQPTFTDATVVLGYIDAGGFLGGELNLDAEAARAGLVAKVAQPLGLGAIEAARGVLDVTLARTVSAIREITVEEGLDPREFSMLAYGGAGPVFVPLVGREMGVREVIVPQAPSAFSAWGMLMTDLVQEYAQTMVGLLDDVGIDAMRVTAAGLAGKAASDLERGGFAATERAIEWEAALRYFGQEHTLEVPLHESDDLDALRGRFHAAHARRYGHAMSDPVQLVHLRVRGIGRNPRPRLRTAPRRAGGAPARRAPRRAFCFARREMVEFSVYERDTLCAGDVVAGPAIVEEATTTLVFHSDQEARVDEYGHLFVTRRAST
ncbi:MAG: hydantoinase/oxoprolinase family protein [Burkholderiales bacterium]|nr:hydantoinase/oxoprolinase family protein [Burkholderiales bacterium]